MFVFRYSALNSRGQVQKDEHTAASKSSLLEYLDYLGLTPLSVEELGPVQEQQSDEPANDEPTGPKKTSPISSYGGVRRKELTVFTRQLATTLHAGLPLLRTIHLLHRETSNPKLKRVLGALGKGLQRGAGLSKAMAEFPQIFDATYLNLIRVGEMSGDLPSCVQRLATLLEKEQVLRRRVRTALAYPTFILVFTTLLTYLLVAFLIPVFSPMFLASGLNLEQDYPLTAFLVKLSSYATDPTTICLVLASLVTLFLCLRWFGQTTWGRLLVDGLKLSTPFLGQVVKELTAARFSRSFSTLLQAGVPLVEALGQVAGAAGNRVVAKRLKRAGSRIQKGEGLSTTLKAAALFPDLLIQMTAIGEEAGSLPDMLERVADYYDDELDASIASFTAILEPSMMVIIGALVGVFVMGVLLPILGISTGMENQL